MATIILSVLASAAAGAAVAHTMVKRELKRAAAERAMQEPVRIEPPATVAAPPVVAPTGAIAAAHQVVPVIVPEPELAPEILMVLSAAVAAFLGKRARIRSARLRQGNEMSSAWAQQGRVFVQASHNLPHHTGGRF